ncbi:MAG: hypothetical protein V3T49_02385 [Dehalococcoidia bacterium]
MVGTIRTLKLSVMSMTMLAIAILLILATACSGDEETSQVASSENGGNAASGQSASLLNSADADDSSDAGSNDADSNDVPPPDELVIPVEEPETGSDEAAVLSALAKVVTALRTDDYDLYIATCNPTRSTLNRAQVEFVFESVFSPYGNLKGINHRDVSVRLFKDETAMTESVMYEFDSVLFERYSYSYSKVDGEWYADSNCG